MKGIKQVFIATLLCFVSFTADAYPNEELVKQFEDAYGRLLERHIVFDTQKDNVRLSSVNYAGWSQDSAHYEARQILLQIEDPFSMPPVVQLAFWINVYNFLMVDVVLRERVKTSVRSLSGVLPSQSVWRRQTWELFGDTYSLHRIEHEILRPMNEARIHYAINCASISCPDLHNKPFTERGIFAQLDERGDDFINNPTKGVYIEFDADGNPKRVEISKIFKWFEEDWGDRADVARAISDVKGMEIKRWRYMDYNWNLNGDW